MPGYTFPGGTFLFGAGMGNGDGGESRNLTASSYFRHSRHHLFAPLSLTFEAAMKFY
jgi:hypothetical protein